LIKHNINPFKGTRTFREGRPDAEWRKRINAMIKMEVKKKEKEIKDRMKAKREIKIKVESYEIKCARKRKIDTKTSSEYKLKNTTL
jgi:hypothetical protein